MLVRHEFRHKYSQTSWFMKSNEYSWSAPHMLCSQISLLLAREARTGKKNWNRSETSHLAVCLETPTFLSRLIKRQYDSLVNPECSIPKERDLYLPSDKFPQHFYFIPSQTPNFINSLNDITKSSQWIWLRETRLCFHLIITSYVHICWCSICDLEIFSWTHRCMSPVKRVEWYSE